MANPQEVEAILRAGAERLRPQSAELLDKVRHAVGLRTFA
jgi:tryptophanyl-tRNA synthetase